MRNDKFLRTDFVRLRNMLTIYNKWYASSNDEATSIQDRRLGI